MSEHTYTFGDRSNSYFMGSDVVVTRDDGEELLINGKDGMCAFYVKDRTGSFLGSLPEDVRELAEDLNRSNRNQVFPREWPDAEYTDYLYESEREVWWHDAEWLAQDADFKGVYSSGRSGGWCCIDGTDTDWWPDAIMHPEPLPQPDEDSQYLAEEKYEARKRLIELGFALQDNIADRREAWIERIREDHAQLQVEREEVLMRGTE